MALSSALNSLRPVLTLACTPTLRLHLTTGCWLSERPVTTTASSTATPTTPSTTTSTSSSSKSAARARGSGTIYVYAGSGTTRLQLERMFRSLQTVSGTFYTVQPVTASQIRGGALEEGCVAVVFGGGEAGKVVDCLGKEGALRIRDYVFEGGTYFGVCAGAYLGSSCVVFRKGGNDDIIQLRPLGLFPGVCAGPLNANFRVDAATEESSSMFFATSFLTRSPSQLQEDEVEEEGDISDRAAQENVQDRDLIPAMTDSLPRQDGDQGRLPGQKSRSSDLPLATRGWEAQRGPEVTTVQACYAGGGAFYPYPRGAREQVVGCPWTAGVRAETLAYCPRQEGRPAVVVKCRAGRGVAVLSSPHLEWPAARGPDDVTRLNLLGLLLRHGGLRSAYVTRPLAHT